MTRATVIINPVSGAGRDSGRLAADVRLAKTVLGTHGIEADVRVTDGHGAAAGIAREAIDAKVSMVVAWGGDGTVNEIAGVLAFGPIPLAIVPAGSGNGLARDLGVPLDARAALAWAASGRERIIDAGELGGALFFNVAGIGLDARIASLFAKRGPARRGMLAYARITARELLRHRPGTYRLGLNGVTTEHRAILIAFANSRQYGNGAQIAPRAQLDDGAIDVVVVEVQSLMAIARRLPSLFRGTLRASGGVLMERVSEATVSAEGTVAFHVDGEPRTGGPCITLRTHAGALRVRVPRA